ncbi:hypothetical protein BDZ91DRAFT_715011 [Kalaharituber pfeilii]|nr:hypothetical protein BDZ91DRAFT_715011 [Kalaharituber pfeilii]
MKHCLKRRTKCWDASTIRASLHINPFLPVDNLSMPLCSSGMFCFVLFFFVSDCSYSYCFGTPIMLSLVREFQSMRVILRSLTHLAHSINLTGCIRLWPAILMHI